MFRLSVLGSFSRANKEFLAAKEFAELELGAETKLQIENLRNLETRLPPKASESYGRLWWATLVSGGGLLRTSLLWNLFAAICTLLAVLASRALVDSIDHLGSLGFFVLLFFIGEISCNFARFREGISRSQLGLSIEIFLLSAVNRKLRHLSPEHSFDFSKGNLKTLVGSDIENVCEFILAGCALLVSSLALILVLTPALYFMAGWVGVLGVGIALIQVPVSLFSSHFIEIFQRRIQKAQDKLTTRMGEWLRNMRLVRYLGWQDTFRAEIAKTLRTFNLTEIPKHVLECLVYSVSISWWMMPILGMLIATYSMNQPLELGALFGSVWALAYLTNFIAHLPYLNILYGSAAAGMKRIRSLLESGEINQYFQAPKDAVELGTPIKVHFKGIKAGYKEKQVLDIPALTLDVRDLTAVVGEVGSGKSTLVKILIGELHPSAGSILIEDDRGNFAPLWRTDVYYKWRSALAVVQQDGFLSNTSVVNNITLSADSLSDQASKAALQAELQSDIALFDNGFEEEVGETGINLSGGQKSRLSISRAFYSGRKIFVLDDPLSAVDARTEKKLMDTILSNNYTGVLISHRIAELHRCPRVLVLSHGKIIEDGVPSILLGQPNSAFRTFVLEHQETGPAHEELRP